MLSVGLIINPLAGIGGPAGLAGSDGAETQAEAIARGARPLAGERAARFLRQLRRLRPDFELSAAAAGEMGAAVARREGIGPGRVVGPAAGSPAVRGSGDPGDLGDPGAPGSPLGRTTADDTVAAARAMLGMDPRPDVIVFAGGDGTARDVHDAVGREIPVLGVPAGVKMQSAVFARSPEAAAALLAGWSAEPGATSPREVADIDEEARRQGRVVSRIWGELRVPAGAAHLQGGKVGQTPAARGSLPGLAAGLAERLDPAKAWLLGPGGTLHGVAEELGLPASLLGVDLHLPGRRGAARRTSHLDLSAADIERLLGASGARPQVVVSPIGGQGFLLGRGNQQIGAAVLGGLAPDDLLIVAAPDKLGELGGGPLYADLPEGAPAERLLGPRRVITGRRDTAMIRLLAA